MRRTLRTTCLFLMTLALVGCAPAVLQTMPDCSYGAREGPEYVFVLPSFEEYVHGSGTVRFYVEPSRSAELRLTTFRYEREFAGRRYKLLGSVAGEDGRYRQWILEDCRVLFTPVEQDER